MWFKIGRIEVVAFAMGAVLSLTSVATAQTTYYVNGDCGDDSWTGLSPACGAPDGPKATIQAGINAADNFDIVEVADGVYRGEGNKNLEFFTKAMSIHSVGGPENCVIDCENDGFGFTFCTLPDDQPVTIEGFTIRNGRHFWAGGICISAADVTIDNCIIERCVGTGEGTSTFGGAVMIKNSPVLISNTIIRSNTSGADFGNSGSGAGIYSYGDSVVTIEDSRIEDNEAITKLSGDASGGGVYSGRFARLIMTRCSVTGNHITAQGTYNLCVGGGLFVAGGSGQSSSITDCDISHNWIAGGDPNSRLIGGGASLGSECDMSGCMVTNNTARNGGGLSIGEPSVTLNDLQVSDNEAERDGGGCYVDGQMFVQPANVQIRRNTAGRDGGGVYCAQLPQGWGPCEITDNFAARDGGGLAGWNYAADHCTISRNHAGRNGGGAYADFAVSLDNSLINGNTADGAGGGVYIQEHSYNYLRSATIVDNSSQTGGGGLHIENVDPYGDQLIVNSIIRNNAPVSFVDVTGGEFVEHCNIEGGWPGVGNLDVDPRFVDPENDDYRLSAGSLCIDAGDNRKQNYGTVDHDGFARRVDDPGTPDSGIGVGAIVDIGAYEFQGTSEGFLTVHPRPGVVGRSNALQAAGATPGHVVYFVYGSSDGLTGVPGCPGINVLIAHPRIAAQATADNNGNASKVIAIPGAASGQTVVLQAVDHEACDVSNVVRYRFP